LRCGFVDGYHLRSVSIVARFEGASGKQRNLERAKIIARDGGEHRVLRFVHRERPAFRNKPASNPITTRVERKIDAASRRLHARAPLPAVLPVAGKIPRTADHLCTSDPATPGWR